MLELKKIFTETNLFLGGNSYSTEEIFRILNTKGKWWIA